MYNEISIIFPENLVLRRGVLAAYLRSESSRKLFCSEHKINPLLLRSYTRANGSASGMQRSHQYPPGRRLRRGSAAGIRL